MNLEESLERVLKSPDTVTEQFYRLFLDGYPEVRAYFASTDFRVQSIQLSVALMVVVRDYVSASPSLGTYLNYLGTKHRDRKVPLELYPPFRDALLATLEQFHGADWTPDLAGHWKAAVDRAGEKMLQGYEQRFHV
jgi:hemoglobin-like flavoprotein